MSRARAREHVAFLQMLQSIYNRHVFAVEKC